MRFVNMTNNKLIDEAIGKAMRLLSWDSKMLSEISTKSDWKYGLEGWRGVQVADKLMSYREDVKIFTYRPFNPLTRAIAMTNGDGAIHFNIYKIHKTTMADKVGTIQHEYAHLCGFKHGSNWRTKEKELHSVPYWLTVNSERFL